MKKVKVGGIVVILGFLILGTFYDLQISQKLFNPSSNYGKFFEAAGELPMTYIGCFSAAAMIVTVKDRSHWLKKLEIIVFGLLGAFFALMSVVMLGSHLALPTWGKILLTLVTSVSCYLLAKAVPEKQHINLRPVAKVGVLFAFSAILVITILKMLWGRMRFRAMVDPTNQFTRWYLPQKLTLDNEFMSFPSGHSANSSVIFWLTLLPNFVTSLKNSRPQLEVMAFVWIGLVMVSRIVMGAHFATDVIIGMSISLGIFYMLKKKIRLKGSTEELES